MIFKTRTVTLSLLIYGYETENDDSYCLSFMGVVNPPVKAIEFLNLISRKTLTVKNFSELKLFVEKIVGEMGYKLWFMDTLPENQGIAERLKPFKTEDVEVLGKKLRRYWYNI